MPYKNPERRRLHQRRYQKEHYEKNKSYYLRKNNEYMRKVKQFIADYKTEHACMDCGNKFSACVMDFDHRDPKKKLINLAMASRKGWSIDRVIKEIEKCDLVCANCHRIRTHLKRESEPVSRQAHILERCVQLALPLLKKYGV